MATNTVQYSNGRQEVVTIPKAFSPGDLVAVTHRRDGGVVVQRVSPIDIGTVPGEIMIDIGTVPARTSVGVKFYFKRYIPGGQTITVDYIIVYLDGSTGGARYYSSSADWSYINSTNVVTLPYERACALQVKVAGLVSGDYFRVDLFTFAGTYKNGENVTDGSFESGAFGDGVTQWSKNDGGKVRIINTDAYSGSYCCEFYG